jgi:hypothetical protein
MALRRHKRQLIAAAPQKMISRPSRSRVFPFALFELARKMLTLPSSLEPPHDAIVSECRAIAGSRGRGINRPRGRSIAAWPKRQFGKIAQSQGCPRRTSVNASSFSSWVDLAASSRLRGSKGKAGRISRLSAPMRSQRICGRCVAVPCYASRRCGVIFPRCNARPRQLGRDLPGPGVDPSLALCCGREAGAQSHGPGALVALGRNHQARRAREPGGPSPKHLSSSRRAASLQLRSAAPAERRRGAFQERSGLSAQAGWFIF